MVDMFATPERAQTVVFTDAYNTLGYSFLVAGDRLTRTGRTSTTRGDDRHPVRHLGRALRAAEPAGGDLRSIVSDNNYAPHMEVMNGRADAHITDHVNNILFMQNNPNADLRTVPDGEPLLNATGLAYAIRPGDPHFHAFLNTWIATSPDSGRTPAQEVVRLLRCRETPPAGPARDHERGGSP